MRKIKDLTTFYRKKGYGLLWALIFFYLFFFFLPNFFRKRWSLFTSIIEEHRYFFMILFWAQHLILFVINNSVMYLVYITKIPFFEQYRVNPAIPWPWEKNIEKWSAQMKKTLKFFLFNNFILIPIAMYFGFQKENVNMRYDSESFPEWDEILSQFLFF